MTKRAMASNGRSASISIDGYLQGLQLGLVVAGLDAVGLILGFVEAVQVVLKSGLTVLKTTKKFALFGFEVILKRLFPSVPHCRGVILAVSPWANSSGTKILA